MMINDWLPMVTILNVITMVTPGLQLQNKNISAITITRPCSLEDYVLQSQCVYSQSILECKDGFTRDWIKGINPRIKHLRLVNWPGECINVERLQYHYPELLFLELINSTSLKHFAGRFNALSKIQNLTVFGMSTLWEIPPEIVSEMEELRVMDLHGNMLRHMKFLLFAGPRRLERIFLRENSWDCSDGGLDWLAMESENGTIRSKIIDYDDLVCQQQLYRGKPLNKVMDIIRLNTIKAIVHNPQYKKLADLYLDNNSISAVKELEGTEWFSTFRVLSLRGNLLKQIPIYAFDKAFQANNNIMHVFLGNNPWRCDCHYIPRFQSFLLKYKRVVRDFIDVRCMKSNDKTRSLIQISTIPLGNVCSDDIELPIRPINIVNLVLLALILIVVGRFLYDWHNFKRTGKLPWLSSVLP